MKSYDKEKRHILNIEALGIKVSELQEIYMSKGDEYKYPDFVDRYLYCYNLDVCPRKHDSFAECLLEEFENKISWAPITLERKIICDRCKATVLIYEHYVPQVFVTKNPRVKRRYELEEAMFGIDGNFRKKYEGGTNVSIFLECLIEAIRDYKVGMESENENWWFSSKSTIALCNWIRLPNETAATQYSNLEGWIDFFEDTVEKVAWLFSESESKETLFFLTTDSGAELEITCKALYDACIEQRGCHLSFSNDTEAEFVLNLFINGAETSIKVSKSLLREAEKDYRASRIVDKLQASFDFNNTAIEHIAAASLLNYKGDYTTVAGIDSAVDETIESLMVEDDCNTIEELNEILNFLSK